MRMRLLWGVVAIVALLCAVGGGWVAAGGSGLPPSIWPPFCGVDGSVDVSWRIDGGAPPYAVTVAGVVAETDDEQLSVSCADIRAWVTDGLLFRSVEVALPVRVVDANGAEIAAEPMVMLLAAAPQIELSEMSLLLGYTDLHLYTPWPFWPPVGSHQPPLVAVFRYRAVGSGDWRYAMPFPPAPQKSAYELASHVDDLDPETRYELQAAWVWYGVPSRYGGTRWYSGGWMPAMDAGAWDDAANWWREWNDPRAVRWSTTRRFRPQTSRSLSARATSNELQVSWLGELSEHSWYFVTVRSDDWPGVIWGDRRNPLRRLDQEAEQDVPMSAVISGLPPDSMFEVTVARALPTGFGAEPPLVARVRTPPDPDGLPPRGADPRGFVVSAGAHDIRVQLRAHGDQYENITLKRLIDGQVAPDYQFFSHELDHQRKLPTGGTEFVFTGLPKGSTWRLYVNLYPVWGDTLPFVCAIRDIQLASRHPDDWFDRYFYSAPQGGGATVSFGQIPADLGPTFPYVSYCQLMNPGGE